PLWRGLAEDNYYYAGINPWDIMSFFTLFLYVLMLAGVTYGIVIYTGVHFYKTMYTDEGYLTHTLPVGKHQLLVSKILVSGIWVMLVIMAVIASVTLLILSFVGVVLPEGYTVGWFLGRLFQEVDTVVRELRQEMGIDLMRYLTGLLFSVLVGPFVSVTTIFGAISIGQLFTKLRVLMAIVSYIGIMICNMLINSAVRSITMAAHMNEWISDARGFDRYINSTVDSGNIIGIVMAALLYLVSWLVISRKLNME
ncbi:MAG: hypothetical protein K2G28_07785, partial [Acetatifactor sp.]|nr:hypothetical protein [Acetatifactor sp.]